jgi:hypothetical protein
MVISDAAIVPSRDDWDFHLDLVMDTHVGSEEALVALRVVDVLLMGLSMFNHVSPVVQLCQEAGLRHRVEVVVVMSAVGPVLIPRRVDLDGDGGLDDLRVLFNVVVDLLVSFVDLVVLLVHMLPVRVAFTPWLDHRHGSTSMEMAVGVPEGLVAVVDGVVLLLSGSVLNFVSPVGEFGVEGGFVHDIVVITTVTGSVPGVTPVNPSWEGEVVDNSGVTFSI